MGSDLVIVLVVLGVALVLFVSDRVRLDLVALLVVVSLTLTGVLTPQQALAGFSDPLVVMIAGLFVVSGALVETGLAARVGAWIARVAGEGELRLTAALMLATAALSAFMSSTGTVAIMLPIAVRLAWRNRLSPSKLLVPVAFAALMGGTLTLIATPPNLVASQTLAGAGHAPLGFLSLAPVGLAMLLVSVLYVLTVGRRLLPARAPAEPVADGPRTVGLGELAHRYGLADELRRFVVAPGSPLAGATLGELRWPELLGVRVVAVDADPVAAGRSLHRRRQVGVSKRIGPFTTLEAGDRVLVQGPARGLAELADAHGLGFENVVPGAGQAVPSNLVFAEVLVTPRSSWQGKTLAELRFRDRYRLVVLAVQRAGERLSGDLSQERLRFGDVLLVRGFPQAIEMLRRERDDAVLLSEASDGQAPAPRAARAPLAAAVILAMLAAMALTPLPLVTSVLLAVIALVATGCVSPENAYRSVQWPSVVLLAGMLPLATALTQTGGVELAAGALTGLLGGAGPVAVLAGVYLVTVAVTQFLTNTTSAVLMAPIALQAAEALAVSPAPLLVAVALGASCTLINPVSSPVTTLVLGPGHYRFSDLPKVGVPLQLLLTGVVLLLVPLVFPL
ncbi:MAG TPA: SLC13 family permease [Trueperaceae bacterium]|nr:SLC13 family permease [Trueperaceae bacterium]